MSHAKMAELIEMVLLFWCRLTQVVLGKKAVKQM